MSERIHYNEQQLKELYQEAEAALRELPLERCNSPKQVSAWTLLTIIQNLVVQAEELIEENHELHKCMMQHEVDVRIQSIIHRAGIKI